MGWLAVTILLSILRFIRDSMWLLFLTIPAVSGYLCPEQCNCSLSRGEEEWTCGENGKEIQFSFAFNDYVNIYCLQGSLDCSSMVHVPVAQNTTLTSLTLDSCQLPQISCVLRQVGASGTEGILIKNALDPLRMRHVEGVQGLKRLMILSAEAQTTVPNDVVAHFPSLQDFRMIGARVKTLETSLPSSITNLELSSDGIERIEPGAFRGFENVTALYLLRNKIINIHTGDFEGLHKLQTLDLSFNPIKALEAGGFASIPLLKNLHLVATRLEAVHTGAFSNLHHLEMIKIDMGSSKITFQNGCLSNLPRLKSVIIKRTLLNPLPSNLFEGSSSIITLEITQCRLSGLPPAIFQGLRNLERLDLSGNRIDVLPENIFASLRKLISLNLKDNGLKMLPEHVFSGLSNLRTLSLDRNELLQIPPTVFHGPRNLETLTLSGNQLSLTNDTGQYENVSPFKDLPQLVTLDLSRNRIAVIFDDWRIGFGEKMKKIDLSWNEITKLREKDISFIGPQLTVDLSFNKISTIQLSNRTAEAQLILNNNPFVCDCQLFPLLSQGQRNSTNFVLDSATCDSPADMRTKLLSKLDLTFLSCSITDCPTNCSCSKRPADSSFIMDCETQPKYFPNPFLHSLKTIKLQIKNEDGSLTLPNSTFPISKLNLTNLGLKTLPVLPKSLKELDVSYNQLKMMPKEISQRNLSMYLVGNDFDCSCSRLEDIKALFDVKHLIEDHDLLKCNDGSLFFSLDLSKICAVYWTEIIGGIIIGVSVSAMLVAIIFYNYADEIKFYMYVRGWDFFIYEEEIDGKKYDVLISYSDEKERFVVETLVPAIEAAGYKVCARYKDWDIGDWIPNRVAETVDVSRRTLVLLTNSYFESIARLELQATRMKESRERRRRLIIILEESEVNEKLSKKFLVLKDPGFWERLKKRLPKQRQAKSERKPTQRALNVLVGSGGHVAFEMKTKEIVKDKLYNSI